MACEPGPDTGEDMIKTKIAGAAAALALLAAPAVAAAHGGGHGHHHKHHAKKAHARDLTGSATGTIASFAGGELTIALPGGKSFAALVTDRTVVICRTSAPATASRHRDDGAEGDDHGDGRCGTGALVAGAKV